jgi:hypothetical protein
MPSRLPKAHRAVTFHPSRHASPRVSTAIEQNENMLPGESIGQTLLVPPAPRTRRWRATCSGAMERDG